MSTLRFPSGIRAHIFVSWLHPYKEQKFVVVGSEKMALFNDVEKKDKLLLFPHKIHWRGNFPVPDKKDAEIVEIDLGGEPLRQECGHFLECIRLRNNPKTDGEEGLNVLMGSECLSAFPRGWGETDQTSWIAGDGQDV